MTEFQKGEMTDEIIIDEDEEVEYIVNKCEDKRCTKKNISKIMDLYYEKAAEEGDPETHFNRIVEETGLPRDFIELVFEHQFEFLVEKGVVDVEGMV